MWGGVVRSCDSVHIDLLPVGQVSRVCILRGKRCAGGLAAAGSAAHGAVGFWEKHCLCCAICAGAGIFSHRPLGTGPGNDPDRICKVPAAAAVRAEFIAAQGRERKLPEDNPVGRRGDDYFTPKRGARAAQRSAARSCGASRKCCSRCRSVPQCWDGSSTTSWSWRLQQSTRSWWCSLDRCVQTF